MTTAAHGLPVEYFDGHSAQACPAWLSVEGPDLVIWVADPGTDGESGHRQERLRTPWRKLDWPDAGLSTQRMLHLPQGGMVCSHLRTQWDDWVKVHQPHTLSWVHRAQTSLRFALLSVAIVVPLGIAGLVWGVPWLGEAVVDKLPPDADVMAGEAAEKSLSQLGFGPSKLDSAVQRRWQQAFQASMAQSGVSDGFTYRLRFMAAPNAIGPNAIALPGGQVIVTDQLMALLDKVPEHDREDALLGVLGHEAGHVHHRHGLRTVVAGSAAGLLVSAWLGDASTLLAAVPTALATLAYSRDAERQADQFACQALQRQGRPTRGLMTLFQLIDQSVRDAKEVKAQEDSGSQLIWSTHPPTPERLATWARCAVPSKG